MASMHFTLDEAALNPRQVEVLPARCMSAAEVLNGSFPAKSGHSSQ